ncbi:MAG: acetyl-CoA carboxylase biotin carboxyl carrier protein [Myxococcota bacterium]|nr:acetyl-CoA carboxylase biotin carboxyl carrier protein [Myxococcota bacterium]
MSIEEVRALAQLACELELAELELCRPSGEQVRIRRAAPPPTAPLPASASLPAPMGTPAPAAPSQQSVPDLRHVTSPFVGTFYRSAGPTLPPFVEEGQQVRKGQTLCIIEAMKLMNELEAEYDCVIVQCLVQNGSPVEYGQKLFSVRPC